MDLIIKGKSAIVCGASKGLGKACAKALAQEGVHLTIIAREEKKLFETAKEIEKDCKGIQVIPLSVDFTTEKGVSSIIKVCPSPDILVTNLGRLPHGNAQDFSRSEWLSAMDTFFLGPLFLTFSVINAMCDNHYGRIINILGTTVKSPISSLALTNAARTSLASVSVGIARDIASFNVTINNILPGPINTEGLIDNWANRAAQLCKEPEELLKEAIKKIPAARLGTAEEIADLCVFLCNHRLGYLTAQNLVIDGGAFPGLF